MELDQEKPWCFFHVCSLRTWSINLMQHWCNERMLMNGTYATSAVNLNQTTLKHWWFKHYLKPHHQSIFSNLRERYTPLPAYPASASIKLPNKSNSSPARYFTKTTFAPPFSSPAKKTPWPKGKKIHGFVIWKQYLYLYVYLEPNCPLFLKVNPPKRGI